MANGYLYGLWLVVAVGASEAETRRFAYVEPHMGTRFQIILYAPDQDTADRAQTAAFARIAELEQMMSDYRPNSELMRLCAQAGGEPVPVSAELFYVLEKAQEVSRKSDGAFDVTIGPLARLWREARKTKRLPDPDQLAKAKALVGYQLMKLDATKRTVQLLKKGMQLDLGGIAKGYAADEALKVLRQHGITRALAAAGGDIAVSDAPPDRQGWVIGVAPLDDPDSEPSEFLLLKNAAVSTSGEAEQYVEIDGQRYSHIVDPRTGLGMTGRNSVTVVAPHGIQADSLTKLVALLGPDRGLPLIDAMPATAAYGVRKTAKGNESYYSKRWQELPRKRADD
ncbi:MAG: FAD:protein FMN transferase [Gemmataceae bacterium]